MPPRKTGSSRFLALLWVNSTAAGFISLAARYEGQPTYLRVTVITSA